MRVSIRTAALGCAFALCAAVFIWISSQTGVLRFAGTMQWLIGHTEGYMLLAFGMGIFLVVISAQWNAIANHFRIRNLSLADVEVRHPRLPRCFEISQTAALTLSFVILFTQFAAIVYAMAYVLASTSAEVKYTRGFIAADIDNDGDLDYIGINNHGSIGEQNIDVYRSTGIASFTSHWTFGTSLGAIGGVAGDVDLDGDVDLVVFRNNGSANMTVYKNDGTGFTWVPSGIPAATGILDAVLTDIDGDGDLDLVTVKTADTTSAVYINDGTGTFAAAASTLPAGVAIAAADFNSDGTMDIATINASGNGIYVYANSGTGAFTSISVTAIGQVVESMEVGDMDGNGTIDIVTF
ncbi:MAG TPA: VCBS repeat-containing protein, partial [Candidatus Peribacteria bacterium]|nr:VCBS repeat-containing protein [Candidatus Peribacteria bacterium]